MCRMVLSVSADVDSQSLSAAAELLGEWIVKPRTDVNNLDFEDVNILV